MRILAFILFFASTALAQDTLRMNEDTYVVINNMRVEGNKKTKEQVVFGESKLRISDTISLQDFNQELLDSRRNLLNIRLFTEVEIYIDKWTDDNLVDLVFQVQERWYIYPIPFVSLDGITYREWQDLYDRDFNRLTYGLSGSHQNLTGRADRLNVDISAGFQRQLGFNYNMTGVDEERNWGVGFRGNFARLNGAITDANDNQFESILLEDQVIENRSAGFSISRRKEITRWHRINFDYVSSNIVDSLRNERPDFFENSSSSQEFGSIGYSFNIEKRNLAEYATEGYNLNSRLSYNGLFNEHLNFTSFSANYNHYQSLGENKKHYFSGSAATRILLGDDLPFSNLVDNRPPNLRLPRGYQEYQIFPKSYYSIKTEYRYNLLQKVYTDVPLLPRQFEPVPMRILPKVFADFGQTFSNQLEENNELNDDFLYSFGVGVDVVTLYNTPILLEMSRNHLGDLSFNIGIGTSF